MGDLDALGLAVPALLLLTGFSAGRRDRASAIGRMWLGTVAVYALYFRER